MPAWSSRAAARCPGLDYQSTTDQLGYHWNDAANTYNWESGLYPAHDQWNFVALVVEPEPGHRSTWTPAPACNPRSTW